MDKTTATPESLEREVLDVRGRLGREVAELDRRWTAARRVAGAWTEPAIVVGVGALSAGMLARRVLARRRQVHTLEVRVRLLEGARMNGRLGFRASLGRAALVAVGAALGAMLIGRLTER